jgi:aspartate-semialdehyde dehydrogenase
VAIIALVAAGPLARAFGLRRVQMSTYQAASGAGAAAMEELWRRPAPAGRRGLRAQVLPHPYAFNLFSHNTEIDPESGYNGEEEKVMAECRRVLDQPDLPISVTSVRVPVLRRARDLHERGVRSPRRAGLGARGAGRRARRARGGRPRGQPLPDAVRGEGQGDVLVGRIRATAPTLPGARSRSSWPATSCCKGAALNAVQIAERLFAPVVGQQGRSSRLLAADIG